MADERDNFGIKISAPLYDVKDAGDINLMFSSSWPSLPVAYEYNATVPAFDSVTFQHPLGFPPLVRGWAKVGSKVVQSEDAITFNKQKIIYTNYFSVDVQVHIKVYGIDISVSKDYPFVQQPQGIPAPYDPDYGIKLAKEGYNVDDPDLRNFIIHSRTRSPLVLHIEAVNNPVSNQTISYTNPAGYVPWVIGFGSWLEDFDDPTTTLYTPAIVGNQAYPRLGIDPTTGALSVQSLADLGGLASLVVLRDPLFAGTREEIVY